MVTNFCAYELADYAMCCAYHNVKVALFALVVHLWQSIDITQSPVQGRSLAHLVTSECTEGAAYIVMLQNSLRVYPPFIRCS